MFSYYQVILVFLRTINICIRMFEFNFCMKSDVKAEGGGGEGDQKNEGKDKNYQFTFQFYETENEIKY